MSDTIISAAATPASATEESANTRRLDVSGLKSAVTRADPRRLGTQRLVELVAVALVPLGVSLIFAGWRGAASTILVPEQLPYLISGGILGGSLVIGGGLLYVGSWLARLAAQNREQTEALRNSLEALREDLRAPTTLQVGDDAWQGGATAVAAAAGAGLVATPSGSMYHDPTCQIVANRDDLRALDDDDLDAMKPCGMCAPERG